MRVSLMRHASTATFYCYYCHYQRLFSVQMTRPSPGGPPTYNSPVLYTTLTPYGTVGTIPHRAHHTLQCPSPVIVSDFLRGHIHSSASHRPPNSRRVTALPTLFLWMKLLMGLHYCAQIHLSPHMIDNEDMVDTYPPMVDTYPPMVGLHLHCPKLSQNEHLSGT